MAGGRPSKYQEEFAEQAYEHCLLGATDADLAEHFGISETTVYSWKNEFPEFAEAIKRGKAPANADVAHAMYQKATGAEWVEQQAIKLKEVEYEGGKRVRETERVEVVEVTRRAPPDTTAGIFWLKNRRPDLWRDKQDHEHSGPDKGPIEIKDDTEVARGIAFLLAKATAKKSEGEA